MTPDSPLAPASRFRDLLEALFGEAWQRQRRRRRRLAVLALIACTAVAAVLATVGDGGPARPAAAVHLGQAVLTARALPPLGQSPELSVAGDRLIVSDTDAMRVAAGRVLGTCTAASIDPHTLRVVSLARGSCGDPALYGALVLPLVYPVSAEPGTAWGTDELGIRVATVERTAPGGYALGPLLVGYPDCSTCRAQMIYGQSSIWIYAPFTTPGAPGELLRISRETGRLTHRWVLPTTMIRVLLATDADGLWFAPSIETCCSGRRSSWKRQGFLYHVTPAGGAVEPVLDVGGTGASWLAASGHTVWIQGRGPTRPGPLWRLDRTRVREVSASSPGPDDCAELGEGSPTVLGTAAIGVYCVTSGPDEQGVVRVDPGGHGSRTVATIPTVQQYATPDSAVVLDGSYYFLDPPGTLAAGTAGPIGAAPSGQSPAVLYRITAR